MSFASTLFNVILNATTTINVANDLTSTSVNVTYKPDLYLIGNYGGSGWNYANGTNMSEADGIYTTWYGLAQAIVKADKPGTVKITINGEGFEECVETISVD